MPSFTQLLTIAACALAALAVSLPRGIDAHCDNPKLVHSTDIDVNGKTVSFKGFACDTGVARREPELERRATNVCGELCTKSCNDNAGTLPPTTDDCAQIKDAITIFAGKTSPTFTVAAGGLETLTFGTCKFFFQNTASGALTFCWSDLSSQASAAGSACFPPVQPFFSEGLCTATDQLWAMGAAHSP